MRKSFGWRVLVNAVALYVIARYLVVGVEFSSELAIVMASLVLGVVNALIRPIFFILSLPITLISLGLFTFVVNGFMLRITSWIVPGFQIAGFGTAIWTSMLMSLFSAIINSIVGDRKY